MRAAVLSMGVSLGATAAALAEPVRIAAMGDSLTHGYGLVPEDGFVAQLNGWLAARGLEVQVLNAGVSGDTTAGGLSRIGWTLADGPDAMIVWLGGNDLLRGIAPEVARSNLDGILTRARAAGVELLLIGMRAPGNYGADYQVAFDALYPELAARHGALYFDDLLAPLRERLSDGASAAELFQPDGLHPSRAGVAVLVDTIGPSVITLIERAQANGSSG